MANLTSTLTVRLIDAVTGPARAAASSIRGIGAAVDQTNSRRLAIADAVNTMTRDVGRATQDLSRNVHRMSAGFSMPAGFMAFFGARSVYDFEKTSNALQAVTRMTDEQRKSVQALARELNAAFPFTNSEIMSAAFELGRAGLKYEQIVGVLRDTLNLALAGDIDLQESADIATNVLTAMRLPMKTTEQGAESLRRVNDALSYAAANSNTDVRLMGETFKYVGPMAAAAGMSIEEVAAASMMMAKNGIRGSEAGVAMRSALVRMVRPTKPMIAALARLNVGLEEFVRGGRQIAAEDVVASLRADGIDASGFASQIEAALKDPALAGSLSGLTERLTDIIGGDGSILDKTTLAAAITDTLTAAGSEVDFFGFIQALREKGADLGDIARIFDARQGSRLITLLAGDLIAELEGVQSGSAGATDEMARTRMQGVVGEWAALAAAMENLFLAIADAGVLTAARDLIVGITDALTRLSETNPEVLKFGTYALLLMAALAPLGFILGGIVGLFGALAGFFKTIAAASAGVIAVFRAAAGLGAATAAGAAGGAVAAAAAGGAASKGGTWFSKLVKGGGIVGAGLLAKDALDWIDPEGNLWGLTSGIDAWAKENLGFDPSNVDLSGIDIPGALLPSAAGMESTGRLVDMWREQLAGIDARLAEIEANMRDHPDMADAFRAEQGRLYDDRAVLKGQIDSFAPPDAPVPPADEAAAEQAGAAVGAAYSRSLSSALDQAAVEASEKVARIAQILSSATGSVRIKVQPYVDNSAIRGIHADTGVG